MVAFGAGLLAACSARHGSTGAPAPTAASVPCNVPVASADSAGWKLVEATGFTFCVPAGWRHSGARAWRGGGADIQWAVGTPPQTTLGGFRVPAKSTEPLPAPRRFVEMIGGESAELSDTQMRDVDYTAAQWSERHVYFEGTARGPRGADLELMIYRTVRFNASTVGG